MDATTILNDLAKRPLDALTMIEPKLDTQVLNIHIDGHPNSIAWLLWHAGRELDVQLSDLSGNEQVWTSQGFDKRFDLGLSSDDLGAAQMGYGQSPEQAEAIKVDDPSLLVEYLDATTQAQVTYLSGLSDSDLAEVIDAQWNPPVTRASRIVSISVDAAEHVAQAAFILGTKAAEAVESK